MRVAYGYCRQESDFSDLNVDRVWLDGKHTERQERAAMLKLGLRRGDTLVLLSRGDLAPGRQINTIEKLVREAGAAIEINEHVKPVLKRGRKPEWVPSDPERFRRMWKDLTLDGTYVVRLACEDAGLPVTDDNRKLMRSRLVRRFGVRSK